LPWVPIISFLFDSIAPAFH